MSRILVKKVIVDAIEPMANADRLEVARVHGWRIVVQKGQFKPEDEAIYFEIDSFLDADDPRYAFLRDGCLKQFKLDGGVIFTQGLRIRTRTFRGAVSQGLLMPVSEFPEVADAKPFEDDLTEALHVRHYDDVCNDWLERSGKLKTGEQAGGFPSFVPKTDEERIQNLDDETLSALVYNHTEFEVTEKVDGTSCTIGYSPSNRPDNPFFVCSRNFELKDAPSTYWDMVHKMYLDESIPAYCRSMNLELAFQGELSGPGIQGNPDKQDVRTWRIFRIWDILKQRWLAPDERYGVCKDIGLLHVPVLAYQAPLSLWAPKDRTYTMQELRDSILEEAVGKTENGNEREGMVFKAVDGSFSFKAVSNVYLSKEK